MTPDLTLADLFVVRTRLGLKSVQYEKYVNAWTRPEYSFESSFVFDFVVCSLSVLHNLRRINLL